MLVVLDGPCLTDAATDETDEVRAALIGVCDQVVLTDRILTEYAKGATDFSTLARFLEDLAHTVRGQKLVARRPGTVDPVRGLRKHHRAFVEDAAGVGAAYLITRRQQWLSLPDEALSRHGLRIVTPTQYVQARKQP